VGFRTVGRRRESGALFTKNKKKGDWIHLLAELNPLLKAGKEQAVNAPFSQHAPGAKCSMLHTKARARKKYHRHGESSSKTLYSPNRSRTIRKTSSTISRALGREEESEGA